MSWLLLIPFLCKINVITSGKITAGGTQFLKTLNAVFTLYSLISKTSAPDNNV